MHYTRVSLFASVDLAVGRQQFAEMMHASISVFPRILLAAIAFHAGSVPADILETKHNLTGKSGGEVDRRQAAREVCVFCHTPGVADTTGDGEASAASAPVPRWQRSVETAFNFDLFDDIGRMGVDGTGAAPVGSISMACLSCHDNVQAFGVNAGGTSDHPFGVPYRGHFRSGQSANQFRNQLMASQGDLPSRMAGYIGDDSEFRPARTGVVNRRQVWWAAVADTGQRTKNDLPLYPRRVDLMGGYEQVPFVECTSCHDPHSTREVFLRASNEQSKLCMTCHIK